MKVLVPCIPAAESTQFEVPELIPNVWDPNVPFVVAARIWTAPF
jgi:hypothetical protein